MVIEAIKVQKVQKVSTDHQEFQVCMVHQVQSVTSVHQVHQVHQVEKVKLATREIKDRHLLLRHAWAPQETMAKMVRREPKEILAEGARTLLQKFRLQANPVRQARQVHLVVMVNNAKIQSVVQMAHPDHLVQMEFAATRAQGLPHPSVIDAITITSVQVVTSEGMNAPVLAAHTHSVHNVIPTDHFVEPTMVNKFTHDYFQHKI